MKLCFETKRQHTRQTQYDFSLIGNQTRRARLEHSNDGIKSLLKR